MNLIIAETMFADYEQDPQVQDKLFERWQLSLDAVSRVRIPDGWELVFVAHVSDDKSGAISSLTTRRPFDQEVARRRFVLHKYRHPKGGYGLPETHIDYVKNPSRQGARRDEMFREATRGIDFAGYATVVRIALDDDDFWLPSHFENIVKAIESMDDPKAGMIAQGVGVTSAHIAYISSSGVKVDSVKLNRHMTGNKFYVLRGAATALADRFHPWGLPELQSDEARARLERTGIELTEVDFGSPSWVYVRWGDNLSSFGKQSYYVDTIMSLSFPDISTALQELSR